MAFKAGDRVRVVDKHESLPIGSEYTVTYSRNGHIDIDRLTAYSGWHESRFELVPKAEPTDKELADEYRANATRQREIRTLLTERGFTLKLRKTNGLPVDVAKVDHAAFPVEGYHFYKSVTVSEEI
jgi:hypothetical protein